VYVNVGSTTLRSVKLEVVYDPTVLSVVSTRAGADWPGGLYYDTINDPPGTVFVGGACDPVSGSNVQISVITFQVAAQASSSVQSLGGFVTTLADQNGASFGGQANRAFVAGAIQIQISSAGRRSAESVQQVPKLVQRAQRGAPTACDSPPCASCASARQTGDTNWDCVFDLRDVTFLREYLVNVAGTTLLPGQSASFDVDGNGEIDPDDADYLGHASFDLYRFVLGVNIVTTSPTTSCALTISASLANMDGSSSTSANTEVYFVLTASSSSFLNQISTSSYFSGGVLLQQSPLRILLLCSGLTLRRQASFRSAARRLSP